MIVINQRQIKALVSMCSKQETRHSLLGIHAKCKDGALTLSATNGHILGRITVRPEGSGDEKDFEEIIDRGTINLMLRMFTIDDYFDCDFKERCFYNNGLRYPMEFIDGTFPNCEKIIPTLDNDHCTKQIRFNFAYMECFSKALKALTGSKKAYAVLNLPEDNESPVTVAKTTENGEFLGLLMPARV